MKNLILTLTLIAVALIAPHSFAVDYEGGAYVVDSTHSKVGFSIKHLVFTDVEGSFKEFEGSLDLKESFEKSSFQGSVDIASIDTGVEKRDGHLKSADFFDAKKHPKMKFETTSLSGSAKSFQAKGKLSIKGITKDVVFKGKVLGFIKNDGWGNKKVALQLETTINRKDFGLTWSKVVEVGPVVGDQVKIKLNIQAAKK